MCVCTVHVRVVVHLIVFNPMLLVQVPVSQGRKPSTQRDARALAESIRLLRSNLLNYIVTNNYEVISYSHNVLEIGR